MLSFIWNENNKYFYNNATKQIKEACIFFQGTEVQAERSFPLPSTISSFILIRSRHFMQQQDYWMCKEEYGQA